MNIREAKLDDVPVLAELAAKTYADAFGSSLPEDVLADELEQRRSIAYFRLVVNTDTILVAEQGGRLVGYVQLSEVRISLVGGQRPTEKDQAINALYVHSDFQGRGVGKALMDAAFDHPRFRRARNIYVDVWNENVRALSLYRNYGFRSVGECEVVIGGKSVGHDLVLKRSKRKCASELSGAFINASSSPLAVLLHR
jgi:ribosomal protein S18 acetylase RimI-like enzyme